MNLTHKTRTEMNYFGSRSITSYSVIVNRRIIKKAYKSQLLLLENCVVFKSATKYSVFQLVWAADMIVLGCKKCLKTFHIP